MDFDFEQFWVGLSTMRFFSFVYGMRNCILMWWKLNGMLFMIIINKKDKDIERSENSYAIYKSANLQETKIIFSNNY